jgi:myosin heavy subunit
MTHLNETRSMLADMTSDLIADGSMCDDMTLEMSQLDFELSSMTDTNTSVHAGSEMTNERVKELEAELKCLQLETVELLKVRDTLQTAVSELARKLSTSENDTFVTRCRNSELAHDLESTKKELCEATEKLSSCQQQNAELKSLANENQIRADKLAESLRKARSKYEELGRLKRELEIVLIEQEKHVTECESCLKTLREERSIEMESLRQTITEQKQTISALTDDRKQLLDKISTLDDGVRRLKEQLEQERCLAVTRDDHSRTGIEDRDGMIAKLKALVRENQSTADRLKDELRRMNDEAKDKNQTISRLRQTCKELSRRCDELEVALCHTMTSDTEASLPQSGGGHHRNEIVISGSRNNVDSASGGKRASTVSTTSNVSFELIRQTLDFDEQQQVSATEIDTETWRRCHSSTEQTSIVSLPPMTGEGASVSSTNDVNHTLKSNGILSYAGNTAVETRADLSRLKSFDILTGECHQHHHHTATVSEDVKSVEDNGSDETRPEEDGEEVDADNNILYAALCTARQQLVTVELELNSLRQRLEESTAINHALRLELELMGRVSRDDNKENVNASVARAAGATVTGPLMNGQLSDMLSEIHNLRLQLERCITTNNSLRSTSHGISSHEQQTVVEACTIDSGLTRVNDGGRAVVKASTVNGGLTCVNGGDSGVVMHVVCQQDVFEQFKQEIEHCHDFLHWLETAVDGTLGGVGGQVPDNIRQHLSSLWQSVQVQRQLLANFWLSPVVDNLADDAKLRSENESLKSELYKLRQRFMRAKQTIKSAQEHIHHNNRKKEELLHSHRCTDEAIIEQINKTRQVLAQTTHNLETVHRPTNSTTTANKN